MATMREGLLETKVKSLKVLELVQQFRKALPTPLSITPLTMAEELYDLKLEGHKIHTKQFINVTKKATLSLDETDM